MPFPIQAIFLLIVLGFAFYMFQKHVPLASPFKEILYFLVVMSLLFWLLEGFGILHTNYLHRWR